VGNLPLPGRLRLCAPPPPPPPPVNLVLPQGWLLRGWLPSSSGLMMMMMMPCLLCKLRKERLSQVLGAQQAYEPSFNKTRVVPEFDITITATSHYVQHAACSDTLKSLVLSIGVCFIFLTSPITDYPAMDIWRGKNLNSRHSALC